MPRLRREPLNGRALAEATNRAHMISIEGRAAKDGAVLKDCLASYREWVNNNPDAHPLHNLTHHLVSTVEGTAATIRERMVAKWTGAPDAAARVESSVTNSLRRSAGTNYQSLVSYALARRLLESGSSWYVTHPVPVEWGRTLAIKFSGGVSDDFVDVDAGPELILDPAIVPDSDVVVKPDLDILLRNADWVPSPDRPEPVLVLSVKTSLADRAGAAARWKTYFDLATNPCEHACEESCAYRRLGIELANTPNIAIAHGIVTANIYKINSDPYFTRWGELRSNQAKSNTFMFDLRFTTRDDNEDVMAPGWESLTAIEAWLDDQSRLASQATPLSGDTAIHEG